MPKSNREFRTVRGYEILKQQSEALTASMEDYLEMIFRLHLVDGYARVNQLADRLHVQAPSASRVVKRLSDQGYVDYHRYGIIQLTAKGERCGRYLLARHETVEQFLRNLGAGESVFVDTELIEHHFSCNTVTLLEQLNQFLSARPEILEQFEQFRRQSAPE